MTRAPSVDVPVDAVEAWLALGAASARLADQGRRPPCTNNPQMWDTDADPDSRAEAVEACGCCPLMHECTVYADVAAEAWHIRGGRDRTVHRTYRWKTTR